jgi:hypothetical protein
VFGKQPPPQFPGIGLAGVTDPAHHQLPGQVEGNLVPGVLPLQLAQAAAEAPNILRDQQAVRGEGTVAQSRSKWKRATAGR